jgi:outer membrane protein OmpA-like peptidoglycan-associated protein
MIYSSNTCYEAGAWATYGTSSGWNQDGTFYVVQRYGYGCGDSGQGYRFDGWNPVSSTVHGGSAGAAGVVVLSYQSVTATMAFAGTGTLTNSTSPLSFNLTFSEAMDAATLTANDFSNSGSATGCAFAVTGAGTSYTLTASGCSDGTVSPTLAANSVTALSGTSGPSSAVSVTAITIDRTAPTSVSAPVLTTTPTTVGATANAVGASTTAVALKATIIAGQATGGRADFYFNGSLIGSDTTIASTDTTVNLSISTNASIQNAIPNASNITVSLFDAAGNSITSSPTVPVVDYVVPTVPSFAPASGQALIVGASATVVFDLTFSEPVSGLATVDFSNAGGATGCTFTPSAASGTVFQLAVSGCGAGTIQPKLAASAVMDAANLGPAAAVTASSAVSKVTAAPANTAVPAITASSGSLTALGSNLVSGAGTWNNQGDTSAVISYQWQVCTTASAGTCVNISGATTSNLAPDASYLGKYLRTMVTDTNVQGATTVATSNFAGPFVLASQTISFAQPTTPIAYTSTPVSLSATASSGLTVGYVSSTPSICTVDSNGQLTLLSAGTCTVVASQPGNSIYVAATSVSRTIAVTLATQSITLTPPATTLIIGDAPLTLGNSGATGAGAVTYNLTSGAGTICSISAGQLVAVSPGSCAVTVSIAADTKATAATSAPITYLVRHSQVISFVQPADILFDGSGTQTITLTVSTDATGLTPTMTSVTPSVCSVAGFTVTVLATGSCQLSASQAGDNSYVAATSVTRSFAAMEQPGPPSLNSVSTSSLDFVQGRTALVSFTPGPLNGATIQGYTVTAVPSGSGTTVTYSCQQSPCTVPGLNPAVTYTFNITTDATLLGSTIHLASNSAALSAIPTEVNAVTVSNPGNVYVGHAPISLSLGTIDPSFTSITADVRSANNSICSVSGNTVTIGSAGLCALTAFSFGGILLDSQNQPVLYGYAEATISFTVMPKIGQTISFAVLQDLTLPTDPNSPTTTLHQTLQINPTSSANLTVTVVSADTTVCTVSAGSGGFIVDAISGGTCGLTASQTGNDSTSAATPVLRTFNITDPNAALRLPQAVITFSPIADQALFAASVQASVSGTFSGSGTPVTISSSSPSICAVTGNQVSLLAIGVCTLVANETSGSDHRAALPVSVTFAIQSTPDPATIDSVAVTPSQNGSSADAVISFSPGSANGASNPQYSVLVTPDDGSQPFSVQCTSSPCTVHGLIPGSGYTYEVETEAAVAGQLQSSDSAPLDVMANPLSVPNPGPQVMPTAAFAVNAVSQINPSWVTTITSLSPSVCTVSGGLVSLVGPGTCTLSASNAGGVMNGQQYTSNLQTVSFAVTNSSQTQPTPNPQPAPFVHVLPLNNLDANKGPFRLSGETNTNSDITFRSLTPEICSVENGYLKALKSGKCLVDGSANGIISEPQSFDLKPVIPHFEINKPVDPSIPVNSGFVLSVNGETAGADITYELVSGAPECSIENGLLRASAAADCVVIAHAEATATSGQADSSPVTISVRPTAPLGPFNIPESHTLSEGHVQLLNQQDVAAGAELSSLSPLVCTVDGVQVKLLAGGVCVVQARIPATKDTALAQTQVSFNVKAQPKVYEAKTADGQGRSDIPAIGKNPGPSVLFAADSAVLTAAAKASLKKLVKTLGSSVGKAYVSGFVMHQNRPLKVEISLATARAKAVALFLAGLGIDCDVEYLGYGPKSVARPSPADRKATVRWDPNDA